MDRSFLLHKSWILLIAVTIGCSDSESYSPELANVTGTVSLDGKPLPSAVITFIPKDDPTEKFAPISGAITDASGKFTLKFKNGDEGALPGTHSIKISTDLEGTKDPANEKIPRKYNTKTTLTETVKLGENSINFDLKTK